MSVEIFRGIPGVGKSTMARKAILHRNAQCVSADYYFTRSGRYEFNATLLPMAHAECLMTYVGLIRNDVRIVVDNTNLTVAEIAPYYALAQAYGHDVKIITYMRPPEDCIKTQVHAVPAETVRRMFNTLIDEGDRMPRWWKHEIVYL